MSKKNTKYKITWTKGNGQPEEAEFSNKKKAIDCINYLQSRGFEAIFACEITNKKQLSLF
jgi:hypothetical protein